MGKDQIYLAVIGESYSAANVRLARQRGRRARTDILRYYMTEYGSGGVDIDTDEVEWVGDDEYVYLDGVSDRIEVYRLGLPD